MRAKRGTFTGVERLGNIRNAMIQRCYKEDYHGFKYYGAKGVTVCDEWKDPMVFRDWALDNGYSDELTIDRIDEAKGYFPDNCQWITQHEQVLKQSRNSNRTKEDHHIYEREGKFVVEFIKGRGKNRVIQCRQYCTSFEEAVKHRDYFNQHGKELEFDNGYKPSVSSYKRNKLLRSKRAKQRKQLIKEKEVQNWCYVI